VRIASQITRPPVGAEHEKGFSETCQGYAPPGLGQKEHNQSRSLCQKNPLDKGHDFVIMKATYEHMTRLEGSLSRQTRAASSPRGDPGFRLRDRGHRDRHYIDTTAGTTIS
jgi:hypothetical protein